MWIKHDSCRIKNIFVKKILFFLLIYSNLAHSLEIKCNFEEVYTSGQTQNGMLYFKEKKMRYQYFEKSLYTIIYKNNNFYLIHNFNTDIVEKINRNIDVIQSINDIISDYPIIEDFYQTDNLKIRIEKSEKNFLKRIGVSSEKINLSINIYGCVYDQIDDKYFNHFNFLK